MALWQTTLFVALLAAEPNFRPSAALIATWVTIAIALVGLHYNSAKHRRDAIKDLEERTDEIVRRVLADPDFIDHHDQRTKWIAGAIVSELFKERAVSFVSRERYEERNQAVTERFESMERSLAAINEKLDRMPETVRREVTYVMTQFHIVRPGKE